MNLGTTAVAPNRAIQYLDEFDDERPGPISLRSRSTPEGPDTTIWIADPRTLGERLVAIADRWDRNPTKETP